MPVWRLPPRDPQKLRLEPAGDLAGLSRPDRNAVDGADGRDLDRGAGQEELVAGVEEPARDALLAHSEPQARGELQHGVAGDPLEDPAGERRGQENPVLDEEDVLGRALAD